MDGLVSREPWMAGATVREYAAKQGMEVEVALEVGMKEKAEEFRKQGAEIYKKA